MNLTLRNKVRQINNFLIKLFILLNKKRQHYKNRIKQRNGSTFWFIFSRPTKDKKLWKYKNHWYFVNNYKLQTYIKK